MMTRFKSILATAVCLILIAPAYAQNAGVDSSVQSPKFSTEADAAAPSKKSKSAGAKGAHARKAGELETWASDDAPASPKGKKTKSSGQHTRALPNEDGGLPLPSQSGPSTAPSVGYDGSRVSTGIKF